MKTRYAGLAFVILFAGCGHGQSAVPLGQTPLGFTSQEVTSPDGLSSKNFIAFFADPASIQPSGITTGPDGNFWITLADASSSLVRLTPAGVMTRFAAGYPGPIAPGPGGTLWFESPGSFQICKSNTAGSIKCYTIASSGYFGQLVKGPDGNEWYTANQGTSIGKETPAGVNTEYQLPDAANGAVPMGITAGPDGNLWFTDQNSTTIEVGKITTSGVITEYPLGTACTSGLGFVSIVKGKDGNLWVSANCGGAIFASVTTGGVVTTYPVSTEVSSLIVGPDKQLWSVVGSQMLEFNTTSHIQSAPVTLAHGCNQAVRYNSSDFLTLGPEGDVWIAGWTCAGILAYEEKITTIGIRLNGEMSITDPHYGFELGYAVGTGTLTQTISLALGESVQFKNLDTVQHSAAFLGDATANSAPWPASFNGSTTKSPAGTAIGTSGFATGSLDPGKSSPIYETGVPGFYMIGCQYHFNTNEMRTVIIVH